MSATHTDAPDLAAVLERLEVWKKDLLDLSRRNKLVYFNTSRGTRINVVGPAVSSIYSAILFEEREPTFPSPKAATVEVAEAFDIDDDDLDIRPGDLEVEFGGAVKDVATLQKKLYRLRLDARTSIAEQGITTLHLAFGMLSWKEAAHSEVEVRSPLVLVPVELIRERNRPYRLRLQEGDVVVNPSLRHKLENDFGLSLPSLDPFDGFGEDPNLPGYLELLHAQVADRGWTVQPEVWLSLFSFQKHALYEDLNLPGTAEALQLHEVLSRLCGGQADDSHDQASFGDDYLEDGFDQPDVFPVVDADSSQLAVLARVRSGKSLVVQGPPGTGKSQTIVNLIADGIRAGKKILFVSEKRAALDVVKARLEAAGLGSLCLELHSHRASKTQVHGDLIDALTVTGRDLHEGALSKFEERIRARDALRDYVRELHRVRDERGRTAFGVHGELARLEGAPVISCSLPGEPTNLTNETESELLRVVDALDLVPNWDKPENHPWFQADPVSAAVYLPQSLRGILDTLRHEIDEARSLTVEINEHFGSTIAPDNVAGLEIHEAFLGLIEGAPSGLAKAPVALHREELRKLVAVANRYAASHLQAERVLYELDAVDAVGLTGEDQADLIVELSLRFQDTYSSAFARMTSAYRRDRAVVSEIVGKRTFRELSNCLLLASSYNEIALELGDLSEKAKRVAGVDVFGGREPSQVLEVIDWLDAVCSYSPANAISGHGQGWLTGSVTALRSWAKEMRRRIQAARQRLDESLASMRIIFPQGLDGQSLDEMDLDEVCGKTEAWSTTVERLPEWVQLAGLLAKAGVLGLDPFLDACRRSGVGGVGLGMALRRALAARWIMSAYSQAPVLAQFSEATGEQLVSSFRSLDRELKALATVETLATARKGFSGIPRAEEALLRREFAKKRRHLPLRRLLPGIPSLLLSVKPCLLMSPLSVASYLPRGAFAFDLTVFDEASQVTPAEAIGSMLRGSRAVVMGDSKQLPPTSFFQSLTDDDADESGDDFDAQEATAYESILDICRGYLDEDYLRWHYRSRDDRLIAFSNRTFYGGRLVTFPAAANEDDAGVAFHYVSEGVYDRGGTRRNDIEARAVVDLVLDHFDSNPSRSLGVIALSVAQRDAVDLELRRRLQQRPDLDELLSEDRREPFFVKNLEAVQGDERDDVIISIGYGPSSPGGAPTMQFGPVNGQGGERRLNVAVTRARYRTSIVSSMRPDQLDGVLGSRWEGPRVLAEYVRYAARGGRFETDGRPEDMEPDSDFEVSVRDALVSRGLEVDCQIGTSGFRVDLGIRHPKIPTRYILGVECDGAAYHSARTVRDRDRLRQEVLEGLGWSIHRVWSTDWVRQPELAAKRILDRVAALVSAGEAGIRRNSPEPATNADETLTSTEVKLPDVTRELPISSDRRDPTFTSYAEFDRYLVGHMAQIVVAEHLRDLVELEGPVHRDAALRRIGRLMGYRRLGSRIQAQLDSSLSLAVRNGFIAYAEEDFLCCPGDRAIVPRRRAEGVARSSEISRMELEAGFLRFLEDEGSTLRADLSVLVCRAFGFARVSTELAARCEDVLSRLIERGECVEAEGYIVRRQSR